MKRLTITLILLLSLAVARAQEVVDYGITIASQYNDFNIRVTSENCNNILKDHVIEPASTMSFDPITNVLTIPQNLTSTYKYKSVCVDVIVESPCLSMLFKADNDYGFENYTVYKVTAPQSDVSVSGEGVISTFFHVKTLTCMAGNYSILPYGTCIEADKLIVDKGTFLRLGAAQMRIASVDTMIVNQGALHLNFMDTLGGEDFQRLLQTHVELNGCCIVKPSSGLGYEEASHRLVSYTTYGPEDVLIVPIGDLSYDGAVDVTDVNRLIDVILGRAPVGQTVNNVADLNHDGKVDVADVSAVIDIILGNDRQ